MAILLILFPILEIKSMIRILTIMHPLVLPDYTLIIGGSGGGILNTVEVVGQDTTSPVPDCMKNLGNFPTRIIGAVGTTFGMYRRAESEYHI